jgi:hypothetical protein
VIGRLRDGGGSSFDGGAPGNAPERARFAKPGPPSGGPNGDSQAAGQLAAVGPAGGPAGSEEEQAARASRIFDGAGDHAPGQGGAGGGQAGAKALGGDPTAGKGAGGDGRGPSADLQASRGAVPNGADEGGAGGGSRRGARGKTTGRAPWPANRGSAHAYESLDQGLGRELPPREAIGALVFDDGTRKQLTQEDLLWVARAIHGETGGGANEEQAAAMFWALAQRMRWSPTFRHWTMSRLAQAFSQPINPIWLAEGSKCRGSTYWGCSEKRTARRVVYRGLRWEQISPAARRVVVAFAQGRVDNHFVGLVNWFDRELWEKDGQDERFEPGNASRCQTGKATRSRLKLRGDAYLAVRCPGHRLDSWDWKGDEVVAVGPDGTRSKAHKLVEPPVYVAQAE